MHRLRTASLLARLALAWFVLALGAAAASPLMHPHALEVVCTEGAGTRLVVAGEEGHAAHVGAHLFDCALCLPVAPPPPQAGWQPGAPLPPDAVRLAPRAVRAMATAGAPLPARGPPGLG